MTISAIKSAPTSVQSAIVQLCKCLVAPPTCRDAINSIDHSEVKSATCQFRYGSFVIQLKEFIKHFHEFMSQMIFLATLTCYFKKLLTTYLQQKWADIDRGANRMLTVYKSMHRLIRSDLQHLQQANCILQLKLYFRRHDQHVNELFCTLLLYII